jgi:hypothetical protein
MRIGRLVVLAAAAAGLVCATVPAVEPTDAPAAVARGPLRVHPENPRYFTDGSGRAVLLTAVGEGAE